jgi:aryl-alcohol dehydrogenase-like predicted oxidoreductase
LWDYLQEQKDKGVVKNLGLSIKHDLVKNQDNMQIDLASSYGITAIQTVLNPLHQHSLDYVVSAARKNGMTVVGRMPLSKGLIPKLSLDEIEDILEPDLKTKASISTYWEKHNLDTRSMTNAVKIGLTLKWCLEKVDAVVMAHHSLEQLEMNLKILEAIYFPTD